MFAFIKSDDVFPFIQSANKSITSIVYNHLNLPKNIIFEGTTNGNISYLYNAVGQKLQKKVVNASTDEVTDYVNGYQYLNTNLEFFVHAEGYVKYTPPAGRGSGIYSYVFNYTDHLGNIRVSYGKDPATNVLKILEENHYYPFGLKHKNYNSDKLAYVKEEEVFKLKPINTIPPTYKYKYNGKELQDELGLNWTAMDFRNYDMALARFVNPDPMSEQAHSISPYRFGFNSPTLFSDPSGLWEEIAGGWSTNNAGEIAAFMSAFNRSGDSKSDRKKLDIYISSDNNDETIAASKNEVVKTEKVLTELFGYSTIKTIDLPSNNGKNDWDDLAGSLGELKNEGYSFSSFIIDSHGRYDYPQIKIGSDAVHRGNYKETAVLADYFKGTSVYLLACHAGGGHDLKKSMSFVQGLSNLWGANVYANRSWSPEGVFGKPINVGGLDAWWTNTLKGGKQSHAVEHRGEWLKASPGNKVPTVIKNFTLYPYTFHPNGVLMPGVSNTSR